MKKKNHFTVKSISTVLETTITLDMVHKEQLSRRDSAKVIYQYSKPNSYIDKYKAFTTGIIYTDISGRVYSILYIEPDMDHLTQPTDREYTLGQAKDIYNRINKSSNIKYTIPKHNNSNQWNLNDILYYKKGNYITEWLRSLFSQKKKLRLYCAVVFMIK